MRRSLPAARLAALLDEPLAAAAQNILPVARTSAESVEKPANGRRTVALALIEPGSIGQVPRPPVVVAG
jgi:hypothetical protein